MIKTLLKTITAAVVAATFLIAVPARAEDKAPAEKTEKAKKEKKEKKDDSKKEDKKDEKKAGGGW